MRQTESRHVGQSIDCFSLKISAKTWSEFRKNNTSHHEVTTLRKTYIKIKIQIRELEKILRNLREEHVLFHQNSRHRTHIEVNR